MRDVLPADRGLSVSSRSRWRRVIVSAGRPTLSPRGLATAEASMARRSCACSKAVGVAPPLRDAGSHTRARPSPPCAGPVMAAPPSCLTRNASWPRETRPPLQPRQTPASHLDYLEQATAQLAKVFETVPEKDHVFTINGMTDVHQAFSGILFKPWGERERSQKQILASLQGKVASIANAQVFTFPLPSLPGSRGGPPVQFVITTTADYTQLAQVLDTIKAEAQKSGMFIFIDTDLRFETPQMK